MASQKILVIDDSRVIRRMVKDMLPTAGNVEVLEAKDGVEGLDKIRNEAPTLIMLDFLLPKKSGWEVYQEVQKDPQLQVIPLMLMSGRKEEVTEKLPEPFEYFAFVEKPFEKEQLVAAIKEAMQKAAKKKKAMKAAPPAPVADSAGGASDAQVQQLAKKVVKLEKEVAVLKKQLGQLVQFIKQKLK
ncbi:MAG: response regulator [Spirulina sp. SIO3F2]|nr:response regulator [Spirulina sp. SIO3F2]